MQTFSLHESFIFVVSSGFIGVGPPKAIKFYRSAPFAHHDQVLICGSELVMALPLVS